jgi:hypothetical protein
MALQRFVMQRLFRLSTLVCLVQFCAGQGHAQDAPPPVGGVTSPPGAMIFYVARGPAGVCGNNCSEWIAAEGTVLWDSHKRFLALLDRVGDRKLPVILNLKGESSLNVAASIGRLIRSRGFDVSAAATRVKECADIDEAACAGLKRSGQPLDATLDGSSVVCNADCVLMLAGGINRTLPSTAQVVLGGMRIRNRLGPKVPGEHAEGLQSHFNDQYRLYLTQMGVSAQIVDIIERNSETGRAVRLKPEGWLKLRIVTAVSL